MASPQPVDALLAQAPPRWTDTASMLLQDDALPRRVLLVDDEADIGVAMTALMRAVGVSVTHVADGAQAHAALIEARARQQPFDALICDLRLADGADGLALARFDQTVLDALRETQTVLDTYAQDLQRLQALRTARDAARHPGDFAERGEGGGGEGGAP